VFRAVGLMLAALAAAGLLGATEGAAVGVQNAQLLASVGPPAQPRAQSPAVTPRTRLVLTSGPAELITLKTSAGKAVKQMKLGTYKVTVRDRGRDHNAHVVAPGFNRKTKPLEYTGTQIWTIKLARTGSFRFLCDPHAITGMRGSAKILR
jgi:hypothetical protein